MNAPLAHPLKVDATNIETRASSALSGLVAAESRLLAAPSVLELRHITVAELLAVTGAQLCIWLDRRGRRLTPRATTHIGKTDRTTLFGQWVERELKGRELKGRELDGTQSFATSDDNPTPFHHALLVPRGRGALCLLANAELPPTDHLKAERLARLAHACSRSLKARPERTRRRLWPVGLLALAGLSAIPVPLTTLAPAEVVGRDAVHVTAPFDGVVETIHVTPHSQVATGAPLISLEATRFSNEATIAEREERLALARARKAGLSAFTDPAAKADVAVADAEARLARSRLDYARANLDRTELIAGRSGLAVFTHDDWEGRPVATGQTLLEIADPASVELLIHVPLDSGEPLEPGAKVRLFLDHDPATPLDASLTRAAFTATEQPDGHMAFEARAELTGGDVPRIGARGVAKIYGGTAPLAWWVVRKPVTALRQMTGL